jgi:hypothetical protein
MRLRRLTMLGMALLPVIGVAATAGAADGGADNGWKKVHASFTAEVPENNLLATECQESDPEICLYISSNPNMTLAGDLVGSVDAATIVGTSPPGVLALGTVGTVVGTIKGCGSGTFTYFGESVLQPVGEIPLVSQLVPGTGTGDLDGISGTITVNVDGSLTGVFRCKRN